MKQAVFRALEEMGIAYDYVTHEPTHTMEECEMPARALNALIPANLFLRPRRHARYYLLLAHPRSRLNTSAVSRQVDSPRLMFASGEEMQAKLHTLPGSASAMGLLFDEAADVTLLMDRRLADIPRLGFHPCENDGTLAMTAHDFFHIFLPRVGREPIWIDMEG